MELPAQNARLQKQREFLQQRRGDKEKSASYWGLSEIHRRLFHIVPTAPAPDGGDFLPPIAVTGSWPHNHGISLLFGKSIQKPDNIRFHTQEVTGSSPAVSTKKFLISQEIRNFFCLYPQIVTLHFGVFRLTQTVTQKPRGQDSTGEGRMASSVPLRLFFVGYMVWLMTLPMVSAAERFIPSVAWV